MRAIALVCVIMFAVTSCGTQQNDSSQSEKTNKYEPVGLSEATHVFNKSDDVYSPNSDLKVEVLFDKPNFTYTEIGTINARGLANAGVAVISGIINFDFKRVASGPSEKESQELAIFALKREAAGMGANGVIVSEQTKVPVGNDTFEIDIKGIAIKH